MVLKSLKCLIVLGMIAFLAIGVNSAKAQENTKQPEEAAYDPGSSIIHHVMDAHEFHFFSVGHFDAVIPLPIILYSPQRGWTSFCSSRFGKEGTEAYEGYKLDAASNKISAIDEQGNINQDVKVYDFSITKAVAQMFLSVILLVVIMNSVAKKYKKTGVNSAPTGFQNMVEPVITFVRDDIAKPNLGKHFERYMPLLLTFFFFILINNLLGLIPGAANVTGNIAVTALLAIVALIVILFSTNKRFWAHLFWAPGVPVPVKLLLIPVELMSLFIRPAALMIRLFANMIAGHIVILSFVSLIFIFARMSLVAGWSFSPVSLAFSIFMFLVEVLIDFIQAYIFTNLTAVFIGMSFAEEGHEEEAHAAA